MLIKTRNTHIVGKPALMLTVGELSKKQKILLTALENNDVAKFCRKSDNISIKMQDLSCLTAITGKEYSLFSRNDKQFLVVGTKKSINIDRELSSYLLENGFKWTGHTHVGTTIECLIPSIADYETLEMFKQKRSVIFNSVG